MSTGAFCRQCYGDEFACRACTTKLFVDWLRAGCPGVDRAAAVAFHPATMPPAMADAVEAGALEEFEESQKVEGA